jgi:hypothetical protein
MNILKRYKIIREAGKTLYRKVLKSVPKHIFMQVANEFRFMKKGILVCDESDLDILSDRLFYDKRWKGNGAVEYYIAQNSEKSLTDGEREFYQAMKGNRFSLFVVKDMSRYGYVTLVDSLATGTDEIKLVDINFSHTATRGLLLATRVLNFGDFYITSGVAYPFQPEQEKNILNYLKGKDLFKSKRRRDLPENYPVYFYKLHKIYGQEIRFEDVI